MQSTETGFDDGIDQIKPGATTADVAKVWPSAQELGFNDEKRHSCFSLHMASDLDFGRIPAISRLFSLDNPLEFKPGMNICN